MRAVPAQCAATRQQPDTDTEQKGRQYDRPECAPTPLGVLVVGHDTYLICAAYAPQLTGHALYSACDAQSRGGLTFRVERTLPGILPLLASASPSVANLISVAENPCDLKQDHPFEPGSAIGICKLSKIVMMRTIRTARTWTGNSLVDVRG